MGLINIYNLFEHLINFQEIQKNLDYINTHEFSQKFWSNTCEFSRKLKKPPTRTHTNNFLGNSKSLSNTYKFSGRQDQTHSEYIYRTYQNFPPEHLQISSENNNPRTDILQNNLIGCYCVFAPLTIYQKYKYKVII